MPPPPYFERAREIGVALLVVPGVLELAEDERWIVNPKIDAVAVALLRIVRSRSGGVSVEYGTERCKIVVQVHTETGTQGRQRWGGAATRQVNRGDRGPAHRGVRQDVGVFGHRHSHKTTMFFVTVLP